MRRSVPLVLTLAILAAVPSLGGQSALECGPEIVKQGDAVFVKLSETGVEHAEILWQKQQFPMYPVAGRWQGAVPVPPDTAAGGHTLAVTFRRGGETQSVSSKVEVGPIRFPVQHLRMARTTASLYNYPGVEAEDAAIRAAIRTVSEEQLWSGDWALPVRGRFSTGFGVRRIRNGEQVGRHRGTDIAAPSGTPILAPADGRVVLAETVERFKKHGTTVVLDHGLGITSLYIHMSSLSVKEGQRLRAGDPVGRVGSTGVSTGPHLHWAVYVHGEPVEPLLFTRLARRGVDW